MKDCKLLKGAFGSFYVAKPLKNGTMSANRFTITPSMLLQMLEQYAKETCIDNHCSTFSITNEKGIEIMEIKIKNSLLADVKKSIKQLKGEAK